MANSGRCKCGLPENDAVHKVDHSFEPEPSSGEASRFPFRNKYDQPINDLGNTELAQQEMDAVAEAHDAMMAGGASTGEQPRHDKNGHLINGDGSLTYDPECTVCNNPRSAARPVSGTKEELLAGELGVGYTGDTGSAVRFTWTPGANNIVGASGFTLSGFERKLWRKAVQLYRCHLEK